MQGVAPEATLIGVKVLNSAAAERSQRDRRHRPLRVGDARRARIINLSRGGHSADLRSDTAAQAVNNAVNAGHWSRWRLATTRIQRSQHSRVRGAITVAATYDDNYPNCDFPNQTSSNFSVCTDTNPVVDQRCCFSNRSSMLEVAAGVYYILR